MKKLADTRYPIHDLLAGRWSPRSFSPEPLAQETLLSLFEAARWTPSSNNGQPWSFLLVTRKEQEAHRKLVGTLFGKNPLWAAQAPVLVVAVVRRNSQSPAANRYAYYDVGQAVANLTVQASAMGLYVRQMGGFDAEKVRQLFGIPEEYEAITVSAIGYLGQPESLPEPLPEREQAVRTRKPLTEFLFQGEWGRPVYLEEEPAEMLVRP